MKPSRIVPCPGTKNRSTCIDGTYVSTRTVYVMHAAGYELHHINGELPSLTTQDIEAAIAYEQRPIRRLQRALAPVIERWSERLADVAWGWR